MKIFLQNHPSNITLFMRRLGYHPDRRQKPGSLSFSKSIGNYGYPKFHVYVNDINNRADRNPSSTNFLLNLHIDMKQASYKGSSAHSGEYENSEWLNQEAELIKSVDK